MRVAQTRRGTRPAPFVGIVRKLNVGVAQVFYMGRLDGANSIELGQNIRSSRQGYPTREGHLTINSAMGNECEGNISYIYFVKRSSARKRQACYCQT